MISSIVLCRVVGSGAMPRAGLLCNRMIISPAFLSMRKRFGCVIPQPGGDWNPRVTVDHKGIVGVIDDARELHLQNSIELLNDWTDFEIISPYHVVPPSSWRALTGRSCDKASWWHVEASRCRHGRRFYKRRHISAPATSQPAICTAEQSTTHLRSPMILIAPQYINSKQNRPQTAYSASSLSSLAPLVTKWRRRRSTFSSDAVRYHLSQWSACLISEIRR